MSNEMKYKWVPLKSLGPIRFNVPFSEQYLNEYDLEDITEGEDWTTYKILNFNTHLYVEDGIVTGCETGYSCVYNDIELIGLSTSLLTHVFENKFTLAQANYLGDIVIKYECDEWNATLWIEDNIIESAHVGGRIFED